MVTSAMIDSAEDLLHTLTTGERPLLKNLYDPRRAGVQYDA